MRSLVDFFIEMWHDGWLGKLLCLLVFVTAIVTICTILYFVDTINIPTQTGDAVVLSKYRTPMQVLSTGKAAMLIPESWNIEVVMGNTLAVVSSHSKDTYARVKPGQPVRVRYGYGRLSGVLYAKEILL